MCFLSGSNKEASIGQSEGVCDYSNKHHNEQHPQPSNESLSDSEKHEEETRHIAEVEPKSKSDENKLKVHTNKAKKNRRKEKKQKKVKSKQLKVIGVNAAGLMCKLDSFEKLLCDEQPSVFCVQETKMKKSSFHLW